MKTTIPSEQRVYLLLSILPQDGGRCKYSHYPKRWKTAMTGANREETSDITVIRVLIEGPAVSLKGSPTVSPIIAAL